MSDTTTQDSNLTTDHVKALRAAVADRDFARRYSLSVRYNPSENVANVVIVTEVDHGTNHEPRYTWVRNELPAVGRLSNYSKDTRRGAVLVASDAHYTSDTISAMRSLASFVKAGDTLEVYFQIANNNETLRNAQLDHDSAHVIIVRKGKRIGSIFVDDVIAPTHSSALFGAV